MTSRKLQAGEKFEHGNQLRSAAEMLRDEHERQPSRLLAGKSRNPGD
jgi:hypothetical protein